MARPRKQIVALPDHVHRVVSRGKVYYYYSPGRNTGLARKPVRLLDDPTDPVWWQDYRQKAGRPEPIVPVSNFWRLQDEYLASQEFAKLSKSTQGKYKTHLNRWAQFFGDTSVAEIEPQHIVRARELYQSTPAAANYMVAALAAAIRWGIQRGYRKDNPCSVVERIAEVKDGYDPWPWPAVHAAKRQLVAAGKGHLWLPVAVAVYTGQREVDCLQMSADLLRKDEVGVRQEKTGKILFIPIHSQLRAELEALTPCGDFLLANSRGQPWTADGFKSSWGKHKPALARRLGLVFHGLRKTATNALLEAGCSTAEVSSVTGHSQQMVEHYSRKVDQRRLAAAAMAKLELQRD
ncbi:MAG: tyrosine-type recombinase/integrase [Pseudomonadota bacterium]